VRVTGAPPSSDQASTADETGQSRRAAEAESIPSWLIDLTVCAGLVIAAMVVAHGLLVRPHTRVLTANPDDQALVEWLLALGPRVWTGDVHLLTGLLNAPDGVNLLSNASMLTLGALLAPVTAVYGAPVSFAVATAGNLAGTAIAWYLLLRRTLGTHPAAAATGAALCGFGPGMITQSNAHPHMAAQWLVPVVIWGVIRLARTPAPGQPGPAEPAAGETASGETASGRTAIAWLRRVGDTGLLLGLVIAVQLFLGEEVLFLTAFGLALFCVGYTLASPRRAARALAPVSAGLAVAAVVALVTLWYPLWVQFAGPQHVPNGPFNPAFFGADLAGFWSVAPQSLGASPNAPSLVSGPAEYNSFLGTPLLVVAAVATGWLWRRPVVVAAMLAGLVMGALSLGPTVTMNGRPTGVPGPYRLVAHVPAIDGALPTRFALALIPAIAIVLTFALDRALRDERRVVRFVVPAVVALALLPLVPRPLATGDRLPVPRFFTSGAWRDCVRPGGTLVPVPIPSPGEPDKMRWAAAADDRFAIPEGFFIGPYAGGGRTSVGIYSRPTSHLFNQVELTGSIPPIGPAERAQAQADVAYWHASCLVLGTTGELRQEPLRQAVEQLFGPGQPVADVIIWRV
jgi:hypothetical protein